jgi:hypothetical protein
MNISQVTHEIYCFDTDIPLACYVKDVSENKSVVISLGTSKQLFVAARGMDLELTMMDCWFVTMSFVMGQYESFVEIKNRTRRK